MAAPRAKTPSRRPRRRRAMGLEFLESRLLLSAVNTANVAWSTYFGGANDDGLVGPAALAIDGQGNKIIGGWSESPDLPNANNQNPNSTVDTFVAKYDPAGTLLWSTFLGGTDDDTDGTGIAVDGSGNTFITGFVKATDLDAAENASHGGRDAFLAKISPDGILQWSVYLGGSGDDSGRSIAIDASGNAYVTGYTLSDDFAGPSGPATGSYSGGKDAFIAKVDANGNLLSAFYFGGAGDDDPGRIAIAPDGSLMLAGSTSSPALDHARNAFHGGGSDAFLAKINPATGVTQWVTYLGGSGAENVPGAAAIISTGLTIDAHGNAVVSGYTESPDLALAKNKYAGKGDGFVCAVDTTGTLQWSLYLGAGATDAAIDVAFDPFGNIVTSGLMGFTSITGAGANALVAKISPSGNLDWLRQFGGSKNDIAAAVALDSAGNAWIAGSTWSGDLPRANNTAPGGNLTVDPNPGSSYDAFLARIDASAMSQASRLVISTLPTTIAAGGLPVLAVQLQYPSGFPVLGGAATVNLSFISAPGAALGGTTAVPVINGVATFSDLALTKTGAYTLVVTDGLLSAKTARFTITPDLTTGHLVIAQQPAATLVGTALAPKLTVQAVDQYGNLITTDHSPIILATTTGTFTGSSTVTLAKGTATFSNVVFKTAGTYTMTATPATTSTLAVATPVSYVQTITIATTNAIPTPTINAAGYTYGSTVALSAKITANAPTAIAFTGTPQLMILGQPTVLASAFTAGTAKFALPVLDVGSYLCEIVYPGDPNHQDADSTTFTITINPAATTTVLTTAPTSPVFGQTLTLTATVKAGNIAAARTGSVAFYDGGVLLQTVALGVSSSASLQLVPSATGSHHYQAIYLGDHNFITSTSPALARSVNKAKTSLALTPSAASPVAANQTFNLDIQVSVLAPGTALLTNDPILIKDNGQPLGTLTLDSTGHATLSALAYTSSGTHHLQAFFPGDGHTLPVTTPILPLQIT